MMTTLYFLAASGFGILPAAEPAHITPMVTLVNQADALRRLLPDAAQYFVRDVEIAKPELASLDEAVGWRPEEPEARFYYAKSASGQVVGTVTFVRVDTKHGALVVAVGFTPDDKIRDVIVTQTSEETVPWTREALAAGWTRAFEGVGAGAAFPEPDVTHKDLSPMARHMGRAITSGVRRAAALYTLLYRRPGEA